MMSLSKFVSVALLVIAPSSVVVAFTPSHNLARTTANTVPQQFATSTFKTTAPSASFSPLFCNHHNHHSNQQQHPTSKRQKLKDIWNSRSSIQSRFDTLNSAQIQNAKTAGLFGTVTGTVKKAHDPITYMILALLAGLRYDWCFRSPYFWFAFGFCVKWYRARYVYKIPVWDRQPNWNNVITSKDQEKDLKAFTCKNCGSTIFIAKTREFFFEGNTGIGGLGCFSCGAKGKDNFEMDRERIVEDVADEDDYFDYERPLDFVSRAERRKLMKEAQGDEDVANQLLAAKTTGMEDSDEAEPTSDSNDGDDIVDAEIEEDFVDVDDADDDEGDINVESVEEVEEVEDISEPEVEEPPKKAFKKPTEKKDDVEDDDDFDLDNF